MTDWHESRDIQKLFLANMIFIDENFVQCVTCGTKIHRNFMQNTSQLEDHLQQDRFDFLSRESTDDILVSGCQKCHIDILILS